ncbi:MAG: tRNA uridine-5-carboxymethylaminomethyl(34) synthesis GTPase MnmE [Gammaproteobacteria bacterium]|nr:tRNA uridine-5-carboxymethylaminomethyl(34) synthesis GTPase MnmE [Gammaproteobacteria bacterium]
MVHHAQAGERGPRAPVSDTIAAVATAPGRGAVGIVRLSGPQAFSIAERIAGSLPAPRHAALRRFQDAGGAVLDEGLVLAFPAPHSFTGEDVVELQGHGGPVVLDLILRAACRLGARPARPGEFSERAFLNDRMDLAQAEAVADLIDAASAQAARAARRSLDGELSRRVEALAEELIQLRMFVEGALDFSDEDVAWLEDRTLHARLEALLERLRALLHAAAQGRRLREGMTVALAGQPNVGKSTLLNRLSGTDSAIVTEIAGTTRDLLRENIVLDGLPLTVVDTAGLRDSRDPVERIGIERAWKALEQAELVLFLLDDRAGLTAADRELLERLPCGPEVLLLYNKCDLSGRAPERFEAEGRTGLRLAAGADRGLDLLRAEIKRAAGLTDLAESPFSARGRHVEALQRALAYALAARQRIRENAAAELAAEELRLAHRAMGEITGVFSSDDLLGRIFASFCIGK